MARWQPNAAGRLTQAAMELFGERDFEDVTVAEIAERAGLTERTFFRYFADKREVLFGGGDEIAAVLIDAVLAAPETASALDAATAALTKFGDLLEAQRGRAFARRRQRIIASNDELRERELIKLAAWTTAIADALRQRGVDHATATLASEVGMAAFRTAFEQWVSTSRGPKLTDLIGETLLAVKAL